MHGRRRTLICGHRSTMVSISRHPFLTRGQLVAGIARAGRLAGAAGSAGYCAFPNATWNELIFDRQKETRTVEPQDVA